MRLVFTLDHLKVSGGGRILLTYAHRLALRGHDVTVVVEDPKPLRRFFKTVRRNDVPRWVAPDFRPAIRRVARVTPASLPAADAIVAGNARHALACAALPGLVHMVQHDISVPALLRLDGLHEQPRERADAAYTLPCRKVAVSTRVRDVLLARGAASVDVLLNPIDRQQFSFVPEARDAEGLRVLMLDHPDPWKGTAEGLAAFERARACVPELRLVLFSAKNERPSVPCHEFHSSPPQERLRELYSSCPIFVCPSWHEGSGLPSMEAMLCGAALVTYDNGGSGDYAFDGKTAFVAQPRDVVALGDKLALAASDPAERQRVADAGMAFVRSMPDWSAQTARFEAILREVAAG